MKAPIRFLLIGLCLVATLMPARGAEQHQTASSSDTRGAAFASVPLFFVENRGQVDEQVGLYVQGRDKSVYFTPQGLTFVLTDPTTPVDRAQRPASPRSSGATPS